MIHIVGAGPGAVDLITVRGQKLLSEADVVIYAGSLVSRDLLDWARQDARIYDSASMDLEQVMEVMEQAERDGHTTVRLHTGDPCLYGAIREQMDGLDARGIQYDICPRVSSFRRSSWDGIYPARYQPECGNNQNGREDTCAGT